ncbi:MAG: hypothetical protein II044_06300 [Lachnospiraceae bacterium]|nr:hypothetical protein [Lachnospiraceae bacterium]
MTQGNAAVDYSRLVRNQVVNQIHEPESEYILDSVPEDLSFDDFTSYIKNALQKDFPEANIEITETIKNNDLCLSGLVIREDQINISPQIYLNDFYSMYQNGTSLTEIYQRVWQMYVNSRKRQSIDLSFFTDFPKVKDHIIFDLISQKKNKRLLEDVPYIPYLDLAIVFRCLLDCDDQGRSSILIRKDHMNHWQITKDELLKLAKNNTPTLLPAHIQPMVELLESMLPEEELDEDALPMYILSNQTHLNGAASILYQNVLKDFAEKQGKDLFILPSSIHEVLLVPVIPDADREELDRMVQEVNATEVSQDEVLSDHAYYYSRKMNAVSY